MVAEVLDDPTVTQEDITEMSKMWDGVCVRSVQKQQRLDAAQEVCDHIQHLVLHHINAGFVHTS